MSNHIMRTDVLQLVRIFPDFPVRRRKFTQHERRICPSNGKLGHARVRHRRMPDD
jgi:hypothetical protein